MLERPIKILVDALIELGANQHGFPKLADVPLPEPAPVVPCEPVFTFYIGNDLSALIKLDLESPGPAQIGAEECYRPWAERTMLGWHISGYSGMTPPTNQQILDRQ